VRACGQASRAGQRASRAGRAHLLLLVAGPGGAAADCQPVLTMLLLVPAQGAGYCLPRTTFTPDLVLLLLASR
jgi:hypothetical protein